MPTCSLCGKVFELAEEFIEELKKSPSFQQITFYCSDVCMKKDRNRWKTCPLYLQGNCNDNDDCGKFDKCNIN